MLKKVGISLMAALMMSSVALACDSSLSYDEYLECCFTLVDNRLKIQESKQEEQKVLKIDKEVVKKILMEENGFDETDTIRMISRMSNFDAKLQPILDSYVSNRPLYTE